MDSTRRVGIGSDRPRRGVQVSLVVAALIGLAILYAGVRMQATTLDEYASVAQAVGTGTLVAALVTFGVDLRLHAALQKELAENIFLALLSQNAPPWYREAAFDFLQSATVVVDFREFFVSVDWMDETKEDVRITATSLTRATCISPEGTTFSPVWLMPSAKAHESSIERIEIEIKSALDGHTHIVRLDKDAVHSLPTPRGHESEWTRALRAEIPESIAPRLKYNDTYRFEMTGTVVLNRVGVFPLGSTNAVRHMTLEISGTAVPGLDFDVFRSKWFVRPEDPPRDDLRRYKFDGYSMPGQTIVVMWRPSESQEIPSAQTNASG